VEEVFELKVPLPDVVAMQCRQPNLEGTGEIKLRRLVNEALRMRPSRINRRRGPSGGVLDLLIALTSGLRDRMPFVAAQTRRSVAAWMVPPWWPLERSAGVRPGPAQSAGPLRERQQAPIDRTGLAVRDLLIRGFGVRVPGGAPPVTWAFSHLRRRPVSCCRRGGQLVPRGGRRPGPPRPRQEVW
jgi:hypothetical protein